MILRPLLSLTFLALTALPAAPQSPPPAPAFLAADIHASPRRTYPYFYAVLLKQDRYVVRDATMVDLIATAYDVDRTNVQAGPSWLDYDRFDILARVPPGTVSPALRSMLRTLLTQRFHLTLHNGVAPMPAYLLTVARSKLKPAAGAGDFNCENVDQPGSLNLIKCHDVTMEELAPHLHDMASGYLDSPVINATGLEGTYDFELQWNDRSGLKAAGPDGVSIFDAVEKQLGLKLTLQTAPRPVLLVDASTRAPSANPPGTEQLLPPRSTPEFEVATLKPTKPGTRSNGDIANGKVNFTDVPLRLMIDLAWDLNEAESARDNIVNAPKWLDDDHYDLLAKVSDESSGAALKGDTSMDIYEVQLMLQALLIERFQMKAHLEDRPTVAYTLLPGTPKLKPADPTVRTLCKEGPGPDGKDPRIANPILNRLITCRNMTMPELCDELQRIAGGYIQGPVLDSTGINGAFDITLSFSSSDRLPHNAAPSDDIDSAPNGAVTLFSAVKNQLGLKLEKQRRPMPVLVIDHIEQKPVDN